MTDEAVNLELWRMFEDIDPKFTKPITGKSYRGTSPNPQYVVRCLTEMFGPVGEGFGWEVIAEDFRDFQDGTVLHWCRIDFWHRSEVTPCHFQEYGQTKAAFQTSGGKYMVDEDAPKKSLTDAIIKAASRLGVAANIFLGRWDDQKYVDEVNAEYRAEERGEQAKGKVAATVSPEQFIALRDKIEEAGVPVAKVCGMAGVTYLEQFPAAGFDAAMRKLAATIRARQAPPPDEIPYEGPSQ